MMETIFPGRDRKELKLKFKSEEKYHAELIEVALKASASPIGMYNILESCFRIVFFCLCLFIADKDIVQLINDVLDQK